MTDRRTVWLVAEFGAGVLLTGPPFWQLPYNTKGLAAARMLVRRGRG